MAFCKYCGRQLAEGEVCTCQSAQAESTPIQETQPTQQAAAPIQGTQPTQQAGSIQYSEQLQNITGQTKEMAGSLWKIFVDIIKNPSDAGTNYVRIGNLTNAVAFLIIQAIASGLFAICCVSKINGLIGLGGSYTAALKFSGAQAFFLTILYSVILSVINAGLLLAAVKIAKGTINFQTALSATSIRSIILVPIVLVSCILFFINPATGIGVFVISFIICNMFMMLPMRGIGGLNDSKIIYTAIAVMIASLIIFVIFASKAATTYVPSSIKNMLSGDSILELIEEIL